MAKILQLRGGEKKQLKKLLDKLSQRGEIRKSAKNVYRIEEAATTKSLEGRLQMNPRGFGFVRMEEKDQDDVYISPDDLGEAVHGDKVRIRLQRSKREGLAGKIDEVLQRGTSVVVGELRKLSKTQAWMIPMGRESMPPLKIKGGLKGEILRDRKPVGVARIDWKSSTREGLTGDLLEYLGPLSDPKIDTPFLAYRFEIPQDFSEKTLKSCEHFSEGDIQGEISSREDLRGLPFVTIDGEGARDFDDAIALEEDGSLWVAIADVSHYVKTGSALDREASTRGNSFYFPDQVFPMLPEVLSNGLCSLKPEVDRLALAVRLPFSIDGKPKKLLIQNAIINSKARLTYREVDQFLSKGKTSKTLKTSKTSEMVGQLHRLTQKLLKKRLQSGSIDFDFPEAVIEMNEKQEVLNLSWRTRTDANTLVEELMLAANRSVSEHLTSKNLPGVFRIHEGPVPSRLKEIFDVLREYGFKTEANPEDLAPEDLNKLISKLKSSKKGQILSRFLLRGMSPAKYDARDEGHFGLGFSNYCHFTSPIRRYSDLVVHRVLKGGLKNDSLFPRLFGSLGNLSAHLSSRERTATESERESSKLRGIRFLERQKKHLTYEGFITGASPRGVFLELSEHAIEGFLPMESLPRDRYDFYQKDHSLRGRFEGQVFRLGDRIRVRAQRTSVPDLQIEWALATA